MQPEVPLYLKNHKHFPGCSIGTAVPDLPSGNTGNGTIFRNVNMERLFPNGTHGTANSIKICVLHWLVEEIIGFLYIIVISDKHLINIELCQHRLSLISTLNYS